MDTHNSWVGGHCIQRGSLSSVGGGVIAVPGCCHLWVLGGFVGASWILVVVCRHQVVVWGWWLICSCYMLFVSGGQLFEGGLFVGRLFVGLVAISGHSGVVLCIMCWPLVRSNGMR